MALGIRVCGGGFLLRVNERAEFAALQDVSAEHNISRTHGEHKVLSVAFVAFEEEGPGLLCVLPVSGGPVFGTSALHVAASLFTQLLRRR